MSGRWCIISQCLGNHVYWGSFHCACPKNLFCIPVLHNFIPWNEGKGPTCNKYSRNIYNFLYFLFFFPFIYSQVVVFRFVFNSLDIFPFSSLNPASLHGISVFEERNTYKRVGVYSCYS